MVFVVYADGACKGNPGTMAIGSTIQDDRGTELATVSQLLGNRTNNITEYRASIEEIEDSSKHRRNSG